MTPLQIPGKRKTKWPVAVLGATGAVGQMFVRLLSDHPWFEIAELAASERSAGHKYGEITRWLEGNPPPPRVQSMRVIACDPGVVKAPIVFSALDATAAGEVEMAFAKAGRFVLSNAKNTNANLNLSGVHKYTFSFGVATTSAGLRKEHRQIDQMLNGQHLLIRLDQFVPGREHRDDRPAKY